MNKIGCSVKGCNNTAWANGLCSFHWTPEPVSKGATVIGCTLKPEHKSFRVTTQDLNCFPEWLADFSHFGDACEYVSKIAPRFDSTTKLTIIGRTRK